MRSEIEIMEVLKHGKFRQDSKGITICMHCGCKFSYMSEDVHIENHIEKNNPEYFLIGKVFKEYVICPECNEQKEIY